jgi:Flp pilus assembly protein TadD
MLKLVAAAVLLLPACGAPEEAPVAPAPAGPAEIETLVAARRFRAALAEVDAALGRTPGDVALLDLKVRVLRELARPHDALALLLELRKIAPKEARFAYEAGELAAWLDDGGKAREQFAAARALAPDDWRPAVAEAALLLREKTSQADEALRLLKPWLDGPQARVEARFHEALAQEAKGDAAAARAALSRALELDGGHLPSLCNAARLAEAAGDAPAALELLRRARVAAAADSNLTNEIDSKIARLAPPPGAPAR